MKRSPAGKRARVAIVALLLSAPARSAVAQKILDEGIKDIAEQIAARLTQEQKRKIAVLPFRELEGQPTLLEAYLAEELIANLFKSGNLEIVERSMLDKVLGEIKLGQSGLIDPETAKKVGRIVGVDAVVTGTITDLSSYLALNCRIIETQTGRLLFATNAKVFNDEVVQRLRKSKLGATASTEGRTEPEAAPKPKANAALRQEVSGFLFELKKCQRSGDSVECELMITNNREDRLIRIYPWGCRLIDESGNEASGNRRTFSSMLVQGVATRALILFEDVSPQAKVATLVDFGIDGAEDFRLQFRNVPLQQ